MLIKIPLKRPFYFTGIIMLLIVLFGFSKNLFAQESMEAYFKKIEEAKAKLNLYYGEPFIKYEYLFLDNEGLNKPKGVRYNPVTNEIVVLDAGNMCIYIFSYDGKFKKKIGRPGQGPGEFMRLYSLTIDYKGNIYVKDLGRIQEFSKEGKLIKTIRIHPSWIYPNFSISADDEIIINNPGDTCYISVLNQSGVLVKKIGKIDRKNKDERITMMASQGIAFKGLNKRYYVVLFRINEIHIYAEDGTLYKKVNYFNAIERPLPKDIRNIQVESDKFVISYTLTDVVCTNDAIFLLINIPNGYGPEKLFTFNYEFERIGVYEFGVDVRKYFGPNLPSENFIGLVNKDNTIEMFLPYINSAEVIKYTFKK